MRHAAGAGGLKLGAADRHGGDQGALAVRGPAVDPGDLAGDGLEIEQVAEIGEPLGAAETLLAAAVADDGYAEGRRGLGRRGGGCG